MRVWIMTLALCLCYFTCSFANSEYLYKPLNMCYYLFSEKKWKQDEFFIYMNYLKKNKSLLYEKHLKLVPKFRAQKQERANWMGVDYEGKN